MNNIQNSASENDTEGSMMFIIYISVLVLLLLIGFVAFVCQP
jgi:hypothetical protein